MDQKRPIHSSDLDSYNQGVPAYSAGGEPSAPSLPAVQHNEYQSIPMPSNTNRYLIRKRGSNNRHFPINAALFLIGLFIFWKSDNKHYGAHVTDLQ
ncbi:uncharacterized protein EV154DRAFT_560011 [Mucor mucedo]|uniref:uncharacterized protein n=1 Tax=Mucor mucedo TaxID=29922 RepID=UPI0022201AD1|nr:uncharacterized protein EV154DRAFT_560011 [Mucor mucedo]KAI7894936.1 hypothetical protein EV154DRAFT_560011 [Mucor mucedo]